MISVNKNYIQHSYSGFTLVEILVVVGIFTILALGGMRALRDQSVFQNIFHQNLNAVDEGRKILRPLVGEVRSAAPAHTGAYPLEEVLEESFVFYSDIDNDDYIERVHYFLDDGTLKKGITEPSGDPLEYDLSNENISWVIQDVANAPNPLFEYFDSSYDGTTDPLAQPVVPHEVRMVKITITIDRDPARPPAPIDLTTQMTIRNVKDNL